MIGKLLKSSAGSCANRIKYVYGGKKHDHDIINIKTIDTNCLAFCPEIGIQKGCAESLGCMILDMDIATKLKIGEQGQPKRRLKPVFHAILSMEPTSRLIDTSVPGLSRAAHRTVPCVMVRNFVEAGSAGPT